jgi:hypothetical protein
VTAVRRLLVAAFVVGAVGALPSPAAADRVTVTTQNVRYTLDRDRARHDIRQAAEHSSIVLAQEMRYRVARRFAPPGWGTAHVRVTGPTANRGDCATYWSRDVWTFVRRWTVPISAAPFRNGHRWALVTILRGNGTRLAVVNVHTFTLTRSSSRRALYARSMGRVRDLLDGLRQRNDAVIVGGDWNRTYDLRVKFGQPWRTSDPPRPTGSRGGRIDYLRWVAPDFRPLSVRVIGDTYSDHNGVRVTLGIRRAIQ